MFRFVTPHRTGKWYPDLESAQRHACAIGAGFWHEPTRRFVAYVHSRLECADRNWAPVFVDQSHGIKHGIKVVLLPKHRQSQAA